MNKIKVLQNGLRVNGKYVACKFDYDAGNGQYVKVYVRHYSDSLPSEFKPENGTDSSVDYFEKDRAKVFPGDPFYKDLMVAAIMQEASMKNRLAKLQEKWGNR